MIVLASASPRRREILDTLGIAFEARASDADEGVLPGEAGTEYARRVAIAKASAVAARSAGGTFVLGADTVVEVEGEILGKPVDDAHAARMLRALVGRWHEVTTGVALCRAGSGLLEAITVTTRVRMRALEAAAIERYVARGEGRDKAGAYAAQGIAAGIVAAIEGSYTNVVGLPAAETVELLARHGAIGSWP